MGDINSRGGLRGDVLTRRKHSENVQRRRPLIQRCFALWLVTMLISGAGFLGFMLGDRTPPFVRIHGEVMPPNPKPGDEIQVNWTLQGNRACEGTVYRELVDSHSVVWKLAASPVVFNLDSNRSFKKTFLLPVQMAPGPATYRIRTEYICNFFQRWWPIETSGPPVFFNVAQPEPERSGKRHSPYIQKALQ